jgi:signal transduction histidine kinase
VGLRARLILIILLPAAVAIGAHGALRVRQEEAQARAEERQSLALTAKAIQIAVESAFRDRQISDVRRLLAEMVEQQESIDRIRLFDRHLTPTFGSKPLAKGDTVPAAMLQRVMTTGLGEDDYERRGRHSYLTYVLPVRARNGAIDGALEVVRPAAATDRQIRDAIIDIFVRLGLLLIVIVGLTTIALQRQVIRPLAALTDGIQRLGWRRPGARVPVDRGDELGDVARAFNKMAARLEGETERALALENQLRRTATLAVAGKLAAGLAHEVGTPLNIISGRAEFILKSLAANDPHRAELEGIVTQIERVARVIASLLDMVRPQPPQFESVEIATLIRQVLPLLSHAARQRDVSLIQDIDDGLPRIHADPAQVQQVVINLVLNALDATGPAGRVTISAHEMVRNGRAGVGVIISDTGRGIAPELLPRIFDPFMTTKPRGQGTGLGLAICRDIARAHGAEILAESKVGAGSTFTVWVPFVRMGLK